MIDALADLRAGRAVVLFNKPFGMLCQFTGEGGRPTLRDAVPVPEVYPAGRLDADSEGLVVLTAHGPLQARIAHPRHKLAKTYWVQVEGAVSDAALGRLTSGVELNDGLARALGAQRAEVPDWPVARGTADPRAPGHPHGLARAAACRRTQPAGAKDDGGRRLADAAPRAHRRGRLDAGRTRAGRVARGPRAMIARRFPGRRRRAETRHAPAARPLPTSRISRRSRALPQ